MMTKKRLLLASAATVLLLFMPSPVPAQQAKLLTVHDEASRDNKALPHNEAVSENAASPENMPSPENDASSAGSWFETTWARAAVPDPKTSGDVITQMAGWPKELSCHPAYYPMRGLVFADLDLDGTLEIIMSGTDSMIYAWDHTGTPMPGFPVETEGFCLNPPTVADLNNDGDMEIVQLTRGVLDGGRLYVLNHLGMPLPGFPKTINNNNLAGSATCVDMDNDGYLEILVSERALPIGYLHIFEMDGTEWENGWPVALDSIPTGTAAVGDIDADGAPEIVYLSYSSIYVLEADGTTACGWPQQITDTNFSYQSPALADLDHDQDLEIVLSAHKNAAGCYAFHHDGTPVEGWPRLVDTWTYCPPTITDLEGDGELDILAGRTGNNAPTSACFWAWNGSGEVKEGFPYISTHGGGSDGPLTVADIDSDGVMEIFADHNMISASGHGMLFGVDARGRDLPGFPLRPKGYTYMNGAAIGDVDGDGDYDLGVVSMYNDTVYINLYDLANAWHPANVPWATYHNRNQRGGLYTGENRLSFQGVLQQPGIVKLYLHDTPGHRAFLWASPQRGRIKTCSFGWFYLKPDPEMLTFLYNELIPACGELCVPVNIPSIPELSGVTVYLQGLVGPDPGAGKACLTNMIAKTIQ